ncbi:hypothetical protein [Streptomyces sp. RLB3-6]|uniref:hypothetical protein n=1 Tax=Streptomyces sp. RLB3-6 TaxID=2594457 RepID=UPI0011622FCC|nr:hypothetical protein [Streptomyces sp. RLB3-6]QDN84379.1 hypothetical protein FNV61_00180 [Streptomyces sp. RLB3-6]
MSSFASRSTAMNELWVTAQVIAGLPTRPYAPDQWTVAFADFGHDLLVLGTLPTPASCTELAEDLLAVLSAQNLASYEVTAPSAEAAERRAREYFAAERTGVTPWADTAIIALPGTVIPAFDPDDEADRDHEAAHAECIEPHRSAEGYVDCDGREL